MPQQQTTTLAECLYLLDGKSCWSKLFSRDPNDWKRMKTIQNGIKAVWMQTDKLQEYAKRKQDPELLALLNESFTFSNELLP
ncbi:MAG: hypothetical protein Q7R64_01190 [bacterium]|nr:hypothetical protein [bacterium]